MGSVFPFSMTTSEIRRELQKLRHPFRIAVDKAKNPFNIGSVIRTAHSFLAKEIILIGTGSWYKKAAMGMQKYENIREFSTTTDFLGYAKHHRWPLVAFEKDAPSSLGFWNCKLPDDAVMVLGNEDSGIDPLILGKAEHVVSIPMYGVNHSYPLSVAAGIAMAEWARQRYQMGRLVMPNKT